MFEIMSRDGWGQGHFRSDGSVRVTLTLPEPREVIRPDPREGTRPYPREVTRPDPLEETRPVDTCVFFCEILLALVSHGCWLGTYHDTDDGNPFAYVDIVSICSCGRNSSSSSRSCSSSM